MPVDTTKPEQGPCRLNDGSIFVVPNGPFTWSGDLPKCSDAQGPMTPLVGSWKERQSFVVCGAVTPTGEQNP